MRLISGKYKGRKIEGYDMVGTRPTMSRIKESMIAMIQNYIKDSICLDLFAGSGAIGLELLSNGAKKCFFIDNNKKAINMINSNIAAIRIDEQYELLHMDYDRALKKFNDEKSKFDIIFLDPPYNYNYMQKTIDMLVNFDLLNTGGILICESEKEIFSCPMKILKQKHYGHKCITIYKK